MSADTLAGQIIWPVLSAALNNIGVVSLGSYMFGLRKETDASVSLIAVSGKEFKSVPRFGVREKDAVTEYVFHRSNPPFKDGQWTLECLALFRARCNRWHSRKDVRLCAEGYLDWGCAYAWRAKEKTARDIWLRGKVAHLWQQDSNAKDLIEHNINMLPKEPVDVEPEDLLPKGKAARIALQSQLLGLWKLLSDTPETEHFFLAELSESERQT
jgi:hypothetical protein